MANSNNNSGRHGNPPISMQLYREMDIRVQCANMANGNKKPASLLRKPSVNMLTGWSGHANKSLKTSSWDHHLSSGAGTHQHNRGSGVAGSRSGYVWFPNGSTGRLQHKSASLGSDSLNSSVAARARFLSSRGSTSNVASTAPGKYDGLTTAQKVEIIVNDDIQWLKLQQSLRDANGLWTSVGIQQVLYSHVQQRIDEMERLEKALNEENGPLRQNSLSDASPSVATREEIGVVSAVKKFARRASLVTQNYLVHHNNNHSQSGNSKW